MSENLKKLLEKLEQSPELKAELEKNPPKSAEDVIAVAARLGVELTEEDLKADDKEISLENADQLGGGASLEDGFRMICGSANGIMNMPDSQPEGACLMSNGDMSQTG